MVSTNITFFISLHYAVNMSFMLCIVKKQQNSC